MTARIEGLYIARAAGDPVISIPAARAIEGCGIGGDRYNTGQGSFSKKAEKNRWVSLISKEGIDAANSQLEEPFAVEETRRNILTSGIELEALLELDDDSPARILRIGGALLQVTHDCAPCKRPELLSGKSGFNAAFSGHGGVRAKVLQSGLICVGDLIHN